MADHDHEPPAPTAAPAERGEAAIDRPGPAPGPNAEQRRLLALQRSLGNAATARLMAGRGRPAPPPVQRAISLGQTSSTYTVNGETLNDVATEITARPEAGKVTPVFAPDPPTYVAHPNGIVTSVTTKITEQKEMPKWSKYDAKGPKVKAAWDTFYSALDSHENTHVSLDQKVFGTLEGKLVGKKEEDADATVAAVSSQADKDNNDFDTRTDHGRNTGVNINTAAQDEVEKVKSTSADGAEGMGGETDTAVA